jgi:hypothetical protein
MVEAPAGLSGRILEAERRARAGLPLRQRIGRTISVLAGYAMRPQLGMAALLLLMIGASLFFLRARPGDRDSMRVTERGVPVSESDTVAIVKVPEGETDTRREAQAHGAFVEEGAIELRRGAEEPLGAVAAPMAARDEIDAAAADAGSSEYDEAMAAYRAGRYAEAQRLFTQIAGQDGDQAPSAALLAAQAARSSTGCRTAAALFDEVTARYAESAIGHEAAWQAADCYRILGQPENARRHYQDLMQVAGYAERARGALASLNRESGEVLAARKAARPAETKTEPPAAPAAAPKPAAKPPAPPAATQGF